MKYTPSYYETLGIDIHGLDQKEIDRIGQIGLNVWMDEKAHKAVLATSTKLCALKSRCIRAERQKGYPVVGKGEFCSKNCRDRAKILARKAAEAKKTAYLAVGGQVMTEQTV